MENAQFLDALASKDPTPGGGGASAFMGALAACLCSMVGNLTTGKKKYAEYEEDIQKILKESNLRKENLYALIEEDAKAFLPLSKAYAIPKEDPNRDAVMEKALVDACMPPLKMMRETYAVIDLIERLEVEGTRLAVSDVGVAATAARAALEGAIMNVIINVNSMKDRNVAQSLEKEARTLLEDGVKRCDIVYKKVMEAL